MKNGPRKPSNFIRQIMNRNLTVISIAQADLRNLLAAEGYADLGMYSEADSELQKVDTEACPLPQVFFLRLRIYAGLGNWQPMQQLAQEIARIDPENPHWMICWAFATRQAQSIHAAKEILLGALHVHPDDPGIHYNLSCYESRLHHFFQAQRHLARAIQLDSRFRLLAADEKDLEPLWAEIGWPAAKSA
jgi:tetratricopeptide (TPR) repeat protein